MPHVARLRSPRSASLLARLGATLWPLELRGAQVFSPQRRSLSLLQHRHLGDPGSVVSYDAAHEIQEQHRSLFLSWKALPDGSRHRSESPRPLLVSFESSPIFTIGRRQHDLAADQVARLGQKLDVSLTHRRHPLTQSYFPDVTRTSRGGLTTYHGPGQLVLWPVIDMHSRSHARFGVASYASHLETTTQRLLAELFAIQTCTVRDEPGVWVRTPNHRPRKIAALGVHHRRHVTSLGVAVNVDVAVAGDERTNPWSRFVPCGLHDKDVTSVAAEVGHAPRLLWDLSKLAERWASIFEEGLLNGERGGAGENMNSRPLT